MSKIKDAKPKKKGFLATLKESMTKTSEGCGPACGCHVEGGKEEAKADEEPKTGEKK